MSIDAGDRTMRTGAADRDSEDITNVRFPRGILEDELIDMVKYLVVHFDTPVQITLNYKGGETFGRVVTDDVQYKTLNEVPRYPTTKKYLGRIQKRDIRCADFAVDVEYDKHERQIYTGLDFFLVPGMEEEDLSTCDKGIMRDAKKHIDDYFESVG